MKRMTCLLLALCLGLCACAAVPAETSAPAETTLPPETTVPEDTAHPAETTLPLETTVPGQEPSNTVKITDPETMVYAGPAFRYGAVDMVGESGTFTIVEEQTDADGNLWGKLRSGLGWLCLTDPALAPVYADYAAEDFNAYHAYWSGETDYITSIGITAAETLMDVRFCLLTWNESESYDAEVLYTIDTMTPEQPFLAQVTFWGDMTTYGLSFTDESGQVRHYALMVSGKDGSLICSEYQS